MANQEGYGFLYPKKDRKEGQPHLTGTAVLNGRTVEVAAWKKVAKSGAPYLSLKVQDKGPAEDNPPQAELGSPSGEDPIGF